MSARKWAALAGTAAVITLGAATAPATWASSPGCAFSNGCATLHGTDAAGNAVAMDAKYQNKNEILIGYPDQAGDGATSFDGVLHYTHARSTRGWADTGLSLFSTPEAAHSFASTPPNATYDTPPIAVAFTPDVNTGLLSFKVTGGTAPYSVTLSGLSGASVSTLAYPAPQTSPQSASGTISVNGDSLTPGVYNNLVLTVTDSATYGTPAVADSQKDAVTFAARVYGNEVTTPGGSKPFYTFVYAKGGVWSNQCVTDINGSGALRLETCTLGHNLGQDFAVDSANGLLSGNQAHVSNLLAAAAGANSCLTDPSTSNPAVRQSDAADEVAPGGRQLYVNGSCAVNADEWSWGT